MTREAVVAMVMLVTVAVVTPGPNNVIILAIAVRGGIRAAVPLAAGVIAGMFGLLVVSVAGAGALFHASPLLRFTLAMAGATYLCWLGGELLRSDGGSTIDASHSSNSPGMPRSFAAMAGFQFANPKAWVLVLTVTASVPDDATSLSIVAAVFTVVPAMCLLLWASAGHWLSAVLRRPSARRRFDRVMGALLVIAALLLVLGPVSELHA